MNRNSALRLAGITFGTTAIVLATNLVGSVLLARFLGPEGRGALAALLFWPHLFAGIGNISINEALVKHVAAASHDAHDRWLRVALALSGVLGVATAVVGVALTPVLLGAERSGLVELTRFYFVAFVPVSMLGLCLVSFQQGGLRFGRFNQLRLLQPIAYVLGIVALVLTGAMGVQSVVLVTLGSTVFGAVLSWVWAGGPRPAWDNASASQLTRLGIQYHGVNLLVFVSSEIDKLVVLRSTGNHEVGLYAVASAVALMAAGAIGQTASAVLFPKIAALSDEEQRNRLFCSSTRITVSLTIAMNGALALLVPILIPLIFGAAFAPAVPITQALLLAYALKTVRGVIDRSMRAAGIVSAGFYAELTTTAVFLAAAFPLFGAYGLIGVAVALAAAQAAGLLAVGYTVRARLGLRPADWLVPRLPRMREIRETFKRMPSK